MSSCLPAPASAPTREFRIFEGQTEFGPVETPAYRHHKLITTDTGERLAKRDNPATLRNLRDAGKSAKEVRAMVGF